MSDKFEILEAYNAPVNSELYVKLQEYVLLQNLLREAREEFLQWANGANPECTDLCERIDAALKNP